MERKYKNLQKLTIVNALALLLSIPSIELNALAAAILLLNIGGAVLLAIIYFKNGLNIYSFIFIIIALSYFPITLLNRETPVAFDLLLAISYVTIAASLSRLIHKSKTERLLKKFK